MCCQSILIRKPQRFPSGFIILTPHESHVTFNQVAYFMEQNICLWWCSFLIKINNNNLRICKQKNRCRRRRILLHPVTSVTLTGTSSSFVSKAKPWDLVFGSTLSYWGFSYCCCKIFQIKSYQLPCLQQGMSLSCNGELFNKFLALNHIMLISISKCLHRLLLKAGKTFVFFWR